MATRTAERIPEHLIEQAKRADLVALAEQHTTLRRAGAKEKCGPCPRCGGDDRFYVNAGDQGEGFWACRQCHPERGDAIAFARWLQPGLSFRAAVEQLSGNGITSPASPRRQPERKRTSAQPENHQRLSAWLSALESEVAAAQYRLWAPEGEVARAYLESRALEPGTWLAFGLGFRTDAPLPGTGGKLRVPAIVLPWQAGGRLVAVRYRFLETHTYVDADGKEQSHKAVSCPRAYDDHQPFAGRLFGGQALPAGMAPEHRWLLVIEGELNAASCWQAAGESGLDVLSYGSQSAKLSPAAVTAAQKYGKVLVWADEPEAAQRLMAALPGAYGVRSPGGKDANDLLKSGHLGGFLATVRADAATGMGELERLLWALWDAAGLPAGIDAGSAAVLKSLAARLGKEAAVVEPEPGRWVQPA